LPHCTSGIHARGGCVGCIEELTVTFAYTDLASHMSNIDIIRNLYSDLNRGNVAGVLDACTDDSRWAIPGAPELPFAGVHVGKPAIRSFFQRMADVLDIDTFVPTRYLEDKDLVVAIGHYSGAGRPTDRPFASTWVHCWWLRDGRIANFGDSYDTLAVARTMR
jgi:ketosteroid isomerase-like protein